jgi:hypothetical protein
MRGSALHKKHGRYLQHLTVADVPEDFAARLTEMFPGTFARLRLFALDVHDLVLAKLARNSPVDLEDARFLGRGHTSSDLAGQHAHVQTGGLVSRTVTAGNRRSHMPSEDRGDRAGLCGM